MSFPPFSQQVFTTRLLCGLKAFGTKSMNRLFETPPGWVLRPKRLILMFTGPAMDIAKSSLLGRAQRD